MNGKPSASASNKVIISCAITGAIHVPSLTPHLPITPSQIADNAIGAAEAGAAIVHLHARDPEDGRPTPDPEVFAQFLPEIGAASDVVINITTGGGHGMSLEERTSEQGSPTRRSEDTRPPTQDGRHATEPQRAADEVGPSRP
jgi:uncharacterized protein (DUF849 family)